MAKFFVETQYWAHWPKVLVIGRNRDDGTVERRRYVPEWPRDDGVWVKEKTCRNVHEPPKTTTFWPTPHFKCSRCGAVHVSMDYVFYCPWCGARVEDE